VMCVVCCVSGVRCCVSCRVRCVVSAVLRMCRGLCLVLCMGCVMCGAYGALRVVNVMSISVQATYADRSPCY
jgi:hypothetical protein